MINKILVALNTHEPHTHIFNQALYLAEIMGAELKLLSVLSTVYGYTVPVGYYPAPTGYIATMPDTFWNTYQNELREEKESVQKVLSELKVQAETKGVQAEVIQVSGDPGVAICDHAKEDNTDLIVVGSHGLRGLDELLIGSVSSYVMHRASCSVMIVHDADESTQAAQSEADAVTAA